MVILSMDANRSLVEHWRGTRIAMGAGSIIFLVVEYGETEVKKNPKFPACFKPQETTRHI